MLGKLTSHGGRGDGVSASIDGDILTIAEMVAVAVARQMVEDAAQASGKEIHELSLAQLSEGIADRVVGRRCTAAQVLAEIGRIQNRVLYPRRTT